jgi:hypothetical protein
LLFALPLPVEDLHLIPNASLAPLGYHQQETINELDEKIPNIGWPMIKVFQGLLGNLSIALLSRAVFLLIFTALFSYEPSIASLVYGYSIPHLGSIYKILTWCTLLEIPLSWLDCIWESYNIW